MNMPTVLLYHLDSPKGTRIKMLCLALKIRVRTVAEEEFGESLLSLCGMAPKENRPLKGESFSEEMLVMANFSGALLNAFLQGFRKKKIPSVALKAVLTPENSAWDSCQLYKELLREHQALHPEREEKA